MNAIEPDKALQIADIVCADRRSGIKPAELAKAVLSDLEGWRPGSVHDNGREAVIGAFHSNVMRLEAAHG